jgi:hypothetical protein
VAASEWPRYSLDMPDGPAEWCRALELLAGSAEGCTETLLGAHGFTGMQIDGLVEAKLATSSTRAVRAGERLVEVTMVRITDAGRVLLEHGS